MVQRDPGPFEYYHDIHAGVTGDTIRADAHDPGLKAATIGALASELEGDARSVARHMSGDITAAVQVNPQGVSATARNLAAKGNYAVALICSFAGMVDTFDTTVNHCNWRYRTELAMAMRWAGEAAASTPDKKDDAQVTEAKMGPQAKANIQPDYQAAVNKLDNDADSIAVKFKQGPTDDNVLNLFDAGLIPKSAMAFYPTATVTGADEYANYKARVAAGQLPSFADMTEAQRAQFNKDNPELAPYLMTIKNPDKTVVNDVVSLVLPHVDGADADADAAAIKAALDGKTSPAAFQAAFDKVGKISSALALLQPWMTKNNLDVRDVPAAKGAVAYLKTFAEKTWPEHDKIVDYINSDEHHWTSSISYTVSDGYHTTTTDHDEGGFSDADKDGLMKSFANGFLGLSDEHIGGGWDQLPKEFQEYADDLPPTDVSGGQPAMDSNDHFKDLAHLLVRGDLAAGDDLSKHLASTAMTSNSMWDHYKGQVAGGDKFGPWDDDLTGDVMDLVSKNHEATADLLSGHDVPDNYYGNIHQDGTLPSNQNILAGGYSSNFNAELFGHDWKGDSDGQVAHLVDWVHAAHASGDSHEVALSNRAYTGLATSITDTDGGVFRDLMGSGDKGRGDSAAQYNRSLAMAMTDATSDHFDEMASETGQPPMGTADNVRLMTFLSSDHDTGDHQSAAFRLQTLALAHEQDRIRDFVNDPSSMGPRELSGANARLSAMLDSASQNEASERRADLQDAADEHTRNMKIASGVVATLAGKVPVVGDVIGAPAGVGNVLVANLLKSPTIDIVPADLPDNYSPTGDHVTTANTATLLDALSQAHQAHPERYPDLGPIPDVSDAQYADNPDRLQDAAARILDPYFAHHGTGASDVPNFYSDYANHVGDDYDAIANHYTVEPDEDGNIDDFLDDGNWRGN